MNPIEILEEAIVLLRGAPASAVVAYLLGAVPFVLALLFFLNEMTRSPFAAEHLAAWSFGLAIVYIWKNVWQAVFAAELYETLSPGARRKSNPWRWIAMQAALQPVGLTLMLPFPWLVAFFRNAALFAALGSPDPLRKARQQAGLWTRQNWGVLGIVSLGALILFLNILIAIAFLPQLARSFLGIEGDLARLGGRIVNLSTAGVAAAITWMAIDPLLDAVYVLRCYYGVSIATGEDLLAALRRVTAVVALAAMLVVAAPPAMAQVDAAQLDRSIDHVIHGREFTWRSPRAEGPEPQGRWVGWIRAVEDGVSRAWNWLGNLFRRLFEKPPGAEGDGKDTPVSRRTLELLIGLAVALILAAGVVFVLRRRAPAVAAQAVTIAAAVNLADESLTADQLPESSWLQLAEEWMAKGDARLALRAMYLAGLNYLSGRDLVSIRRWKSGLDYRRELERRARATPGVEQEFSRISGIFECGWYGTHGVDRAMVDSFAAGLDAIRNLCG
jgi:hypothetical protein